MRMSQKGIMPLTRHASQRAGSVIWDQDDYDVMVPKVTTAPASTTEFSTLTRCALQLM